MVQGSLKGGDIVRQLFQRGDVVILTDNTKVVVTEVDVNEEEYCISTLDDRFGVYVQWDEIEGATCVAHLDT